MWHLRRNTSDVSASRECLFSLNSILQRPAFLCGPMQSGSGPDSRCSVWGASAIPHLLD